MVGSCGTGTEAAKLDPADATGLAWSAVGLKVTHPERPHRLTLKVKGGEPAALGVALIEPGGAGTGNLAPTAARRLRLGTADPSGWFACRVHLAGLAQFARRWSCSWSTAVLMRRCVWVPSRSRSSMTCRRRPTWSSRVRRTSGRWDST